MRLRCLIVDGESVTRSLLWSVVQNTRHLDVRHVTSYTEATSALKSQFPQLLLLRCCDETIGGERLLKTLQRTRVSVATVALLANPNPEQIKTLVGTYGVLDVLMDNAEVDRIQKALREVTDAVANESDQRSYYRGFFGFVGSIPSFRERKILASAGIGFIQNRSLRLAIEYWRKNPSSQMVALCLNAHETFTSRPDDFVEAWSDYDVLPWQIGMFEAEHHYLRYWEAPIRAGLIPAAIPTLVRYGTDDMTLVPPDEQQRILVKLQKMKKDGELEAALSSMGMAFRPDGDLPEDTGFESFIKKLEERMKVVDQRYPRLTRPPTETGYEDFVPDTAEPHADEHHRMAYAQKHRGR